MEFSKRTLGALALSTLVACGGGEPRLNVLVVTLDTTRADALGAFGGRSGVTPHLDALAASGVAFTNARTVVPLTLPSHASMLTGLVPPRHTVRVNTLKPLPESAVSVAELASEAGVRTAAVVASIALDASLGTAQGFESYDQPTPPLLQAERSFKELKADEVTDRALAWFEARDPDHPFFFWAHYFDPHVPLEAPIELAAGRTPYEAEVSFMDQELGRLLAQLKRDGVLDSTVVIVVADHGESNGEHREATHGAFCFDSTLKVPLIVRYPDGFGAGSQVDVVTSITDVAPTVLDALGLEIPDDLDAQSLYRTLEPDDRGAYFESHYGYLQYGWSPMAGWVTGEHKLVQAATPSLFDLKFDPAESEDVYARNPELVQRLESQLARILSRPALEPSTQGIDPELLERLMSLGYTAGSERTFREIDPFEATDRLAPHGRGEELARFLHAQGLAQVGRLDEAATSFEALLKENPENVSALFELGQLYARNVTGHFDARAIELLTQALQKGRDWYGPHYFLGEVLVRQGRPEEAEGHLRAALESNPRLYPAMLLLGRLLEARGETEEGRQFQTRAQELLEADSTRRGR